MNDVKPFFVSKLGKLYQVDCIDWLKTLPTGEANLIIADPPYNIKKAEWDNFDSQQQYVEWCMKWIKESHRVLCDTGTIYIMGFSEILAHIKVSADHLFAGCKWLIWYYRNKANFGKDWGRSHESILHFRKSDNFTFNIDKIRIPYNQHTLKYPDHPQTMTSQYGNGKEYTWQPHPLGAKPKDVLEMPTLCNTTKEKTLHPTQKPEELIQKYILASSNESDLVIDPFGGAGTTYAVCERHNRRWLGCETDESYCLIIEKRLRYPEQFISDRIIINQNKLMQRRKELRLGREVKQKELF
jgi:site-specific DNA-methyltransferase (adenine-specific)